MQNIRTDLAIERHALLTETAQELTGVTLSDSWEDDIKTTRVTIKDKGAAQQLKKPAGTYVTLQLTDLRYMKNESYEAACKQIAREITAMLNPISKKKQPVLIIGLGNRAITSDSLGPAVIDRLMITRHLFSQAPETITENLGSVCAIAPGVLGITGIETEEIIRGVTEKVNPCAIICVDALAARSMDRVMRTIQICDTGINPGSGVGNNRKEISQKTMGVPVLAIGVPTVVDAATITHDTLNIVIDSLLDAENEQNSAFFNMLKNLDSDERFSLIQSSVSKETPNFLTTPKEIDIFINKAAEIVANGINFALHKDITFSDIQQYIS
ncbi:MAG: GPR endopeptidase [Clostridia bacterium]|nr:GPR endopeptidase [Clostridia bacterium]